MEAPQKRQRRLVARISAPVQAVLEKLQRDEPLTDAEQAFLLTPEEVSAVLTWKKGAEVPKSYLSQMIRDGRLKPDSLAGGNAYRYKLGDVLAIEFRPAGRPSGTGKR